LRSHGRSPAHTLDVDPIKSDQGLDFTLVHDPFRKPVSTRRVKPEGMLFGIIH
jgi:hypothetical protein